jgi:prophage tail gpP-like protein
MTDKQRLFESAVRDAVVVLTLMQDDVFTGPAYTTADDSTDKAKAAGWTFEEIEAEAKRRVGR